MLQPKPDDTYHHGRLRKAILAHAAAAYAEGRDWTLAQASRDLNVSSSAPFRHFRRKADVLEVLLKRGRRRLTSIVSGMASPADVAWATLEFAAGDGRAAFRLGLEPVGLEEGAAMLVGAAARRVAEGESLDDVWASVHPMLGGKA